MDLFHSNLHVIVKYDRALVMFLHLHGYRWEGSYGPSDLTLVKKRAINEKLVSHLHTLRTGHSPKEVMDVLETDLSVFSHEWI